MMEITADLFPGNARFAKYVNALNAACKRYDISTPKRIAAFLAQIAHESGMFRYSREIWGPTPAQTRYEGRRDLGNTQPGDGKRYMGRGFIQITGRANYETLSDALGVDFVVDPLKLEQSQYVALSAAWFWYSRVLNELADNDQFKTITRRINGGLNGYDDRVKIWNDLRGRLGC